jgi:prefoldin subunit 5
MSNKPTLEEISKHYEYLCSQLGDCQYNIRQYENRMKELYNQIDALNSMAKDLKAQRSEEVK